MKRTIAVIRVLSCFKDLFIQSISKGSPNENPKPKFSGRVARRCGLILKHDLGIFVNSKSISSGRSSKREQRFGGVSLAGLSFRYIRAGKEAPITA
jgi:hypothetical protein